jgi:DNA-binding winged helix-turn-helix (wHTH) protein
MTSAHKQAVLLLGNFTLTPQLQMLWAQLADRMEIFTDIDELNDPIKAGRLRAAYVVNAISEDVSATAQLADKLSAMGLDVPVRALAVDTVLQANDRAVFQLGDKGIVVGNATDSPDLVLSNLEAIEVDRERGLDMGRLYVLRGENAARQPEVFMMFAAAKIFIGTRDLSSFDRSRHFPRRSLTNKEMLIIRSLMDADRSIQDGLVRRTDLMRNVWGYSSAVITHTLETHIYRLRQKLKPVFTDEKFPAIVTRQEEGGYSLAAQMVVERVRVRGEYFSGDLVKRVLQRNFGEDLMLEARPPSDRPISGSLSGPQTGQAGMSTSPR